MNALFHLKNKSFQVLTPVPPNVSRILIFDVETTGLLPKMNPINKSYPPIQHYPHIIQFSWVVYNLKTEMLEKVQNYLVRLPDDVFISKEITELTGISTDMCKKGVRITELLEKFYHTYHTVDMVVAHNLHFDATMVYTEMLRHQTYLRNAIGETFEPNLFSEQYTAIHEIILYCTMLAGKDICNIYVESKPKDENKNKNKAKVAVCENQSGPFAPSLGNSPASTHSRLSDCNSSPDCSLIIIPSLDEGNNTNDMYGGEGGDLNLNGNLKPLPQPNHSEYEPELIGSPSAFVKKQIILPEHQREMLLHNGGNYLGVEGKAIPEPHPKKILEGNNGSRKFKKFPKLAELHEHLFGCVPENLHNALVDTFVCLRCFLKIRCCCHMSSRKFSLLLQRYV